MGLLIDDLVQQMLDQTRVVTNGPVLAPREPLRVDVIPGGGGGGVPVNDALSLVIGATNGLDALRLKVSYEVSRNGIPLGSGDFLSVPTKPVGANSDPLSVAFLLAPKVKLVKAKSLIPDIDVALPTLDCLLKVTITVEQSIGSATPPLTRTIKVPFTQTTIEVPLPIPPAICVCCEHNNFTGGESMILLPPGSPPSVGEVVAQYNSVLDAVKALESLISLLSLVLKPLELVVKTLEALPNPYVATTNKVVFEDFGNDFDDLMTSFILVGPTGCGIRFSDDWWDDNKTYKTIDILKLLGTTVAETTVPGDYIMGRLGIMPADLLQLKQQVATMTGQALADVELGIGVFLVHDLGDGSVPLELRKYDDDEDTIQDDIGEAIWLLG